MATPPVLYDGVFTHELLEEAVGNALDEPEFKRGIKESGTKPSYFKDQVLDRAAEIRRNLGEEIEELAEIKATLTQAKSTREKVLSNAPWTVDGFMRDNNENILARISTLVSVLLTIGWTRTPLFMRA